MRDLHCRYAEILAEWMPSWASAVRNGLEDYGEVYASNARALEAALGQNKVGGELYFFSSLLVGGHSLLTRLSFSCCVVFPPAVPAPCVSVSGRAPPVGHRRRPGDAVQRARRAPPLRNLSANDGRLAAAPPSPSPTTAPRKGKGSGSDILGSHFREELNEAGFHRRSPQFRAAPLPLPQPQFPNHTNHNHKPKLWARNQNSSS